MEIRFSNELCVSDAVLLCVSLPVTFTNSWFYLDFINQSEGVKREVDVVVGPPQQAQHEKNSVIKNKWVIDRKIITKIKIDLF